MGELRIIAGSLRHRRIKVPPGSQVRPTSDRVRQALFDILGETVEDVLVLDAFAGSGALGLEAISRGARAVTFVERERDVLVVLRENIRGLGVETRCRTLLADVVRLLATGAAGGPFDLVLADPPYGSQIVESFLGGLVRSRALRDRARIVVEREHQAAAVEPEPPLTLERTVRHGRTCLDFYRFQGEVPPRRDGTSADSASRPGPG